MLGNQEASESGQKSITIIYKGTSVSKKNIAA